MPYEGTLYEFLSEVGLQQYHQDFVSKLGVTAIDHLAYVQTDDVLHLGMTAPEWRRLKASMKKVKKGKFKPGKNTKVSKTKPTIVRVPSQGSTPTGGHIIPASAINILDRELGRGEFGKVMQGVWTDKDGQKIQVAVKCLSPEKLSADRSQDFVKEAAIMYSMNHDHLVKLFGVVLDVDTSLMLVTEFAALRSLLENIKQPALRASFPITLLLEFAGQIADAMRYLHVSNIIHRDLATRNILLFVDDDGTKKVKISDFGLSRRLILGENYRSEMRPNLKLPLAWMPVEALTKLTFTKASDVWSFGVTMWEMFTYGCQPWATHSGEEILKAIDKPALQRLERPDACPVKVYEILLKCWKHEPEKRPSFAEICEELPKAKPVQVRAITQYKATKDGELNYRAEDIITVLDANENTGIWIGILANGKIGTFLRCNTTLMGSSSSTGGSRLRRWKSGFRHDKRDARKSRLTTDAIGTPMGARHIFHVGPDGTVQGDATFGGDYRTLPPDGKLRQPWSSSSSVSSASSASTTRSPPHSPFHPGMKDSKAASSATLPSSRSVQSLPPRSVLSKAKAKSEMTSSTPELASAEDELDDAHHHAPLHADQDETSSDLSKEDGLSSVTEDREESVPIRTAPVPIVEARENFRGIEQPSISPQTESGLEAGAAMHFDSARPPSPDTFSLSLNLEMGSLLDEFMCEWDDRRNIVEVQDTNGKPSRRTPMEDTNKNWDIEATNGDADSCSSSSTSGNTPRPGSLHLSGPSGAEGTKISRGGTSAVNRSSSKKKGAGGAASGAEGSVDDNAPNLTPLHNMIIKDSPSNPAKTYRRLPAMASTPPASGGAVGGRESPPDDICGKGEVSGEARLRVNLVRASSLQDKRDEINFVRLSTSPPQKAENDYIDTSTLLKSNPNSPAVDGLGGRQPFVTSMSTSSSSSSERTSSPLSVNVNQKVSSGDFSSPNEYEELSEASSELPEDVVHPMPTKSAIFGLEASREVGRSQSMRVPISRPLTEDLQAKKKGQFGRSRSLKETAATARAEEVYAKLIGGRISGSPTHQPLASPPVSSSPRGTGSPGKSKNPFLDGTLTGSPSRSHGSMLERMSSVDSSDGSSKEAGRNSLSDRDSRELQFGPGDSLDESVEADDHKHEASVGVKALRNRFDAPSPSSKQTAEAPLTKKPAPPKVPPRGPRSQKPSQTNVVKSTANIVLHSPSGITHSPRGLNNNYSPEGDGNVSFGSLDSQSSTDVKLSPKTLQSLEKVMPRRVRRPVGEGRIKRRSSSEVSDSDSDVSFLKHQSGDFSAQTGDGDSSSDETTAKFLGEERGIGGGVFGMSSPRPLPDLPEDQTNRNTTKPPYPLPPRAHSMDLPYTHQRGPAGSPSFTSSQATVWTNSEVERVDLADFGSPQRPPRTSSRNPSRSAETDSDSDSEEERYAPPPTLHKVNGSLNSHNDRRNPLTRGHTIDVPVIPKRHSTNPFQSPSQRRPPMLSSHSLDAGRGSSAGMGNLVRASPEDIRRLVQQEPPAWINTFQADIDGYNHEDDDIDDIDDEEDYVTCRFDNDDLSDMPTRLPPAPPVPVHDTKETPQQRKSFQQPFNLDIKIPPYQAMQQNNSFTEPTAHPGTHSSPQPAQLIREAEYEVMKPQRDAVFKSDVEKDIPLLERELPPLPPLPDTELGVLSRSRSAHSFSQSKIPASDQIRERRGTLASTRRSETLKEIDERQGTRSLERSERKSRSSDDLPDINETGEPVAESLTDVLARTYKSPPVSDISGNYTFPRPPKSHQPQRLLEPIMVHPSSPKDPPPMAVVNNYHLPPPRLPQRPSADYIDMTHQRRRGQGKGVGLDETMLPPDGGHQKALDVESVRRELPEEVTVDECTQVLKENLWNVQLTVKILKVRYLKRTLLLDEGTCRQALDESNWDLGVATAIIGDAPESSISL